jgi:hypothetical protein
MMHESSLEGEVGIECQHPFPLLPLGVGGIILPLVSRGRLHHDQHSFLAYQVLDDLGDQDHLCLHLLVAAQGLPAECRSSLNLSEPLRSAHILR